MATGPKISASANPLATAHDRIEGPWNSPARVIDGIAMTLAEAGTLMNWANAKVQQAGKVPVSDRLTGMAKERIAVRKHLVRAAENARGLALLLPRFIPHRETLAFRTEVLLDHLRNQWMDALDDGAAYRESMKWFNSLATELNRIRPMLAIAGRMMAERELQPRANKDFTRVRWFGEPHEFILGHQSRAVGVLWKAWRTTGTGLDQRTIGELIEAGSNRFRMDNTFRAKGKLHAAMGQMIMKDTRGHYRLNAPALPPVSPVI